MSEFSLLAIDKILYTIFWGLPSIALSIIWYWMKGVNKNVGNNSDDIIKHSMEIEFLKKKLLTKQEMFELIKPQIDMMEKRLENFLRDCINSTLKERTDHEILDNIAKALGEIQVHMAKK